MVQVMNKCCENYNVGNIISIGLKYSTVSFLSFSLKVQCIQMVLSLNFLCVSANIGATQINR